MKTATSLGYIDVVGEAGHDDGYVKISFHLDADSPDNCPAWHAGEFDGLDVLHYRSISLDDIHWNAWLIFRELHQYHVAGDWFDVRHLVDGSDWDSLLNAAIDGTLAERAPVTPADFPFERPDDRTEFDRIIDADDFSITTSHSVSDHTDSANESDHVAHQSIGAGPATAVRRSIRQRLLGL